MFRTLLAVLTFLQFPAAAQNSNDAQQPTAVFGTTVVIPTGFQGEIYFLSRFSGLEPKVKEKRAKGAIYTTRLDVPPQDFKLGFPGVTDRLEWFAIDYRAKFYVTNPGEYRFKLLSDDGSRLFIDGKEVIDNWGVHPPQTKDGSTCLTGGIHEIRVLYFQGPQYLVALVLEVAAPGERLRVFDTNAFRPPPGDPSEWPKPTAGPCGS